MTEAPRRKRAYIIAGIAVIFAFAAVSTWMHFLKEANAVGPIPVHQPSSLKKRKTNSKTGFDETEASSDDSENDKPINDQKPDVPKYRLLIHNEAMKQIQNYKNLLKSDGKSAGKFLKDKAKAIYGTNDFSKLTDDQFLSALLATKKTQIFAETTNIQSGTNWSLTEARLLGNINVALPVQVFDNGNWTKPKVHKSPFDAYLLFTPGALLTTVSDVDRSEVVKASELDKDSYFALYERRLLPLLQFANDQAELAGKKAIITLPGVGCGCFAGGINNLTLEFSNVLKKLLQKHHNKWQHVSLVYFGKMSSTKSSETEKFGGITYRVVSNSHGEFKELLEMPSNFAVENEESYSNHVLFAVVAWDHLSLPGNDFFSHSRNTDDGVKAAATSSMTSLLGVEGKYDHKSFRYLPKHKAQTWMELAQKFRLEATTDTLYVVPPEI